MTVQSVQGVFQQFPLDTQNA